MLYEMFALCPGPNVNVLPAVALSPEAGNPRSSPFLERSTCPRGLGWEYRSSHRGPQPRRAGAEPARSPVTPEAHAGGMCWWGGCLRTFVQAEKAPPP